MDTIESGENNMDRAATNTRDSLGNEMNEKQ